MASSSTALDRLTSDASLSTIFARVRSAPDRLVRTSDVPERSTSVPVTLAKSAKAIEPTFRLALLMFACGNCEYERNAPCRLCPERSAPGHFE